MCDWESNSINRSLSVPNIPSFYVKSSPAGELSNVHKRNLFRKVFQNVDHFGINTNTVKHSSYEHLTGSTPNPKQSISFCAQLDKDSICSSISSLRLNDDRSKEMDEPEDVEMENVSNCLHIKSENCDKVVPTSDNDDSVKIQQSDYQIHQQIRHRKLISPNITNKDQVFLNKNQRKFNFLWCTVICLAIVTIVVLVLSTFTTGKARLPISQNLNKLKKDLSQLVYGQNEQIIEIMDSLSNIQENSLNLLNFVGSTGTGKTHVVNIIKQHFNVIEIFPNQLLKNEPESVINSLKTKILTNSLSVIVIEDLKSDNLDLLKKFLSFLPKRENLLIICIFNMQYVDENLNYTIKSEDVDLIKSFFEKTDITEYKVIQFNGFNIDNAREWLRNYIIANIQNDIDEQVLETVLDQHDVKYMGFKGLRTKALLEIGKLNEEYN